MMTVDDSGDKAGFIALPTIVHTVLYSLNRTALSQTVRVTVLRIKTARLRTGLHSGQYCMGRVKPAICELQFARKKYILMLFDANIK